MADFWKNKRVLVTGAGGFIGSHLADSLAEKGAEVTALVKYSSSGFLGNLRYCDHLAKMKIVYGNIEDPQMMEELSKSQHTIFHLAALIGIPYSYRAVHSYIETNMKGTFNILHAAKMNKVAKVVVTSTSECYGTARFAPITEEHPLQGQSPYSASKIAADKMAESMYLSFGVPVATLRPFNTYGPRQSARAVIPTIISQALSKKIVKMGSLSPTRDFNYVGDTVAGFLAVAESEKTLGGVFNVGTGKEISIGAVCEMVKKLVGYDFEIVSDEARIRPAGSEVHRLICDYSKAHSTFGWSPKVSFEDGLARTVDFIRKNLDQYNPDNYTV